MKRFILLFFLLAVCLLHAQITLDVIQPLGNYFNFFYPANFNPNQPASQPIFFILNISGSYNEPYKIKFEMEWNNNYAVANITTDDGGPFPPQLTNQDFINNDPIGLSIDNSSAFDPILDAIESYILDTGRIPDGSYLFTFTALNLSGEPISNQVNMTLTVQAPIAIGLITPGSPIGLPPIEIDNQYPEFIWFSNLENYHFRLFDITELGDQVSAEDISSLSPHFQQQPLNTNSLSYPSGAASLQYNRTYAWNVSAPVTSPIGTGVQEYSSVFYLFRVVQEGGMQPDDIILNNFLNQISSQQALLILNLLQGGYELQEIVWQGNVISVEDLMIILQQIIDGELEVKE